MRAAFTEKELKDIDSGFMKLPPFPLPSALQQLLSLPTLVRVKLTCPFSDRDDFIRIWDRGSPTIRHVELECSEPRDALPPGPLLDSARESPISLESLATLRVQLEGGFTVHATMKHTVMSGIFSSADPADVIRKVRITGSILDEPLCEYLDATLSNLPAPPILEFAYDGAT
ncbi:hypothetical protein DFH08DRAFT_964323 [Mycena albidolilacea]|uniref:Uncharacterized protein n=1 Tax=Mycena albidolilacea TaxID=1033008 RepID=A0AAD6ZTW8_9AGAR|nr:hypothetical protein DFH08DRAFT_964323 [Mycena albidolilacea]